MADYIKRSLEPVLKRAIKEFPAVVLTGPRQSYQKVMINPYFANIQNR